jgi:hypothetical protein
MMLIGFLKKYHCYVDEALVITKSKGLHVFTYFCVYNFLRSAYKSL